MPNCIAKVFVHIVGAGLRGFVVELRVFQQSFQKCAALLAVFAILHAPAAAALNDVLGFLEFVVVGAEEDGLSEGDGLEDVVDAHAEAAADIGYVGVAVELGEEADVVDEKYLRSVKC